MASIRLYQSRHGLWYADLHHPDGRRERRSLRTRDAAVARDFQADVEARWGQGLPAVHADAPKLYQVIEDYLGDERARAEAGADDALAWSTLAERESRLLNLVTMRPLLDLPAPAVGPDQVRAWAQEHLPTPHEVHGRTLRPGPKSVRNYLDALSQVFAYAQRHRLVESNPVAAYRATLPTGFRKSRRRRPEIRTLESLAECTALVEGARAHSPELGLVVLHGLDAGLRFGEIRARRWEHHRWGQSVQDRSRALLVRENWPTRGRPQEIPKTGPRTVHMSARLRAALLEERLRQGSPRRGLVFPGAAAMQAHNLDGMLGRLCKRLGLPRVTLTDLRHTYASVLVTYGWGIELIARQMGNSPDTCRRHYARWLSEDYVEPPRLPSWAVPADVLAGRLPGAAAEG